MFKSDPKYTLLSTKEERDEYTKNIVEFKETAKQKIAVFCNAVHDCKKTICACPGYKGSECGPNPNNVDDGGAYAAKLIETNQKNAEKFFGIIPKCCCLPRIIDKSAAGAKYVKTKSIAIDYTNREYWTETEVPNSSNPNIKTKKYTFNKLKTDELIPLNSDITSLQGCESTKITLSKDKSISGSTATPNTKDCICDDGDPTLNYIGHFLNDSTAIATPKAAKSLTDKNQEIIELKQKIFSKWSSDDEKSYRVKKINTDNSIPNFLPEFYYTDNKRTKIKEKDELGRESTDGEGYLFNITLGTKEGREIIIFDNTKYAKDFKGNAIYMNESHKYYYHMPESTIGLVDTSINEFKDIIKKSKEEYEKNNNLSSTSSSTPSYSPGISRFFGGIYENIQTYVGLNK